MKLISFRFDWFCLLAFQGTLKSLLQHHNLKASVLQCSAFFMVQLSNPYMTTGKSIVLTIQMMPLLFKMLSSFVKAFLPVSKRLLISWWQSPSAVILKARKIKSVSISISSPSICHEVMRLYAMTFIFWMLSFKSAFSLSSFTLSRSSLVPPLHKGGVIYIPEKLLVFLPAILIPAYASSSLAFL